MVLRARSLGPEAFSLETGSRASICMLIELREQQTNRNPAMKWLIMRC